MIRLEGSISFLPLLLQLLSKSNEEMHVGLWKLVVVVRNSISPLGSLMLVHITHDDAGIPPEILQL